MDIKIIFLAIVLSFSPLLLKASGIPTVDVANILQTTTSALENVQQTAHMSTQISNQVQQITQLTQQITQLDRQFNSINGSYAMGNLLNGTAEQTARRYAPDDWNNALKVLKNGASLAGSMSELQNAINAVKLLEAFSKNAAYNTDNLDPTAIRYETEGNAAYTSLGMGRASMKQTSIRLARVESLMGQIDSATDLKAASDLNNRMLGQLNILLNEVIRLQSVQLIQNSEMRARQHDLEGENKSFISDTNPSLL